MNPTNSCPECGKPLPAGSEVCPACLMAQAIASRTLDEDRAPREIPPPPAPEEIAEKFPQFEILECLGRGGMGVVYKARQKSLNRLVAIKILAPERERDARFAKEAEMLAKLSHPHIVTIHDFGETGGLYYLVMEFINGVNLRDLLRDGKMAPEQALAIIPPICEALQFAHDHGIVHRDIKPENILLDRDGRVKIADFGIATLAGDAAERAGTPHYMAPEQNGGAQAIDHRADIYALGVVLYEMLTGERPTTFPVAPSRRVQIDVRLDEVVLRALEAEPERRFQTVGDFNTVLGQVTREVTAAPQPRPSRLEFLKSQLLHSAPAILLIAAWLTSGLEKGAVLILSILVVAVLILHWVIPSMRKRGTVMALSLLAGIGAYAAIFAFKSRPSPETAPPAVSVDGLGEFATLKEALNAAPDNAVIHLAEGTYLERVTIRKPVTLIGSGREKTRIVVQGPYLAKNGLDRGDYEKPEIPPEQAMLPAIKIETQGIVNIQGISLSMRGTPPPEGGLVETSLISAERCELNLWNCALVGSVGNGIEAKDAHLRMTACLVAAAWNTGIVLGDSCQADILDCTVRNCYYAGISIRPRSRAVTVAECIIESSAWHGIRYDDCSPKLTKNLIQKNARCGIYASGDTAGEITSNVIVRNEISGISCWNESTDKIERNLFMDNKRVSLSLCGKVSPQVTGNIFSTSERGIAQSLLNEDRISAKSYGSPMVQRNVFWNTRQPWREGANAVPLPEGNHIEDPRLGNDHALPVDSPLPALGIGPEARSPNVTFPIQPEEIAIIPDGDTRDSNAWKRPK
ncbi:pectinesterase family protein [Luteolibacter soli]|uniref:Pectinesterase family protein n=1 Tax=Luteolibacter soli TaxID=3135280 RepID=A0ABU9B0D8_9BACT